MAIVVNENALDRIRQEMGAQPFEANIAFRRAKQRVGEQLRTRGIRALAAELGTRRQRQLRARWRIFHIRDDSQTTRIWFGANDLPATAWVSDSEARRQSRQREPVSVRGYSRQSSSPPNARIHGAYRVRNRGVIRVRPHTRRTNTGPVTVSGYTRRSVGGPVRPHQRRQQAGVTVRGRLHRAGFWIFVNGRWLDLERQFGGGFERVETDIHETARRVFFGIHDDFNGLFYDRFEQELRFILRERGG